MKYEIEFVNNPYYYCHRLICMLTGHELDDVIKASGTTAASFRMKTFKETIRALGFMCNERVVKFDKDTVYPCLMKSIGKIDGKLVWYASVYYDGWVYIPGVGKIALEEHRKIYRAQKITSMLQVWIDIEEKINETRE